MARKIFLHLAVTGALGLAAPGAHATLVLLSGESFTNLGAGNVAATIQATGTESGGVRLLSNGTPAVAPSNTIQPWQALTIGQLGLTNAADFRLIVAPQETDAVLSVTTLGVQVFNPSGTQLFTGTTNQTYTLNASTMTGQGFVFGLDAAQAAQANAAGFGSNNVIGVFGTFVNSTGGPETLYVARAGAVTAPIPEPATLSLLATGLLAGAGVIRRRKAKQ